MGNFLVLILVLSLSPASGVPIPDSATLDELLTLAGPPEETSRGPSYDDERYEALKRLGDWPVVEAEKEARIAEACDASLRVKDGDVRRRAALSLGQRGHSEAIPTIFELAEQDPSLISAFFVLYMRGRQVEPPLDWLRCGLSSKNPWIRVSSLNAIGSCGAVTFRPELEALVTGDPDRNVREAAAKGLSRFGLRESAPALRQAFESGMAGYDLVRALIHLGNDDDVAAVLPLLNSKDENFRGTVAEGLARAQLADSRPACDALLVALGDRSRDVRNYAVQAWGHFREIRAIAPIQDLIFNSSAPIPLDDRRYCIDALVAIGDADAIAVLEKMVETPHHDLGTERALMRLSAPSSARAVWAEYLKDPIRPNTSGGCLVTKGYDRGLRVLVACADAELLGQIKDYLSTTKDVWEKWYLEKTVRDIQARLDK